MLMTRLDSIALADILALKDSGVAESHSLDFKETGVGYSYDDRREFLADATAFANAAGGDIIFGVAESGGVAIDIVGFDVVDLDKEEQRLRSLLRDGVEPRISNAGMRWLTLENSRRVLIVRIQKSWIAPHRVTLQGHDKFYIRDSNGKHPMNVDELRRAFTFSDSIVDRLKNFRGERVEVVKADGGPLPIMSGAKVIMHFVPLTAITDPPDL